MSTLGFTLPTVNNPLSSEAPVIRTAFQTIQSFLNGANLDSVNIAAGAIGTRERATTPKVKAVFSAVSIPNSVSTAVTLANPTAGLPAYQAGGTFWAAGNPTRLTIPTAGLYAIHAYAAWANDSTGTQRLVLVRLNGSTLIGGDRRAPAYNSDAAPALVRQFVANDYLELMVFHDITGGVAPLTINGDLSASWLGP